MNLAVFYRDAKKAVHVAALIESAAVAEGLLNHAQAAIVTSVLGAVSGVLVYYTNGPERPNVPAKNPDPTRGIGAPQKCVCAPANTGGPGPLSGDSTTTSTTVPAGVA